MANNWTFPQLKRLFIEEMNTDSLIIWATGLENEWTISFVSKSSGTKSFKTFYKNIEVTNGKLFLTNYSDLTMVAMCTNEKIPNMHGHDLFVDLKNGRFEFKIRQLFDPEVESGGAKGQADLKL